MVEAAIPDIPGVLGQFPQCHSRHDRPTIAPRSPPPYPTIAATSPLSPGISFLVLSPEFHASP
ncbi:hypothetical protein [Prochlorothrix hollandica]|uniref:hypothetical protein n=1 Tax=Prochlorothrix hollandica TaxID=1223 RepID=UPI0033402A52